MADNLPMTVDEQKTINGLITQGPKTITPKNIDLLANALIKATPEIYKKAYDIISKNADLNKAIVDRYTELSRAAISADNENIKIVLDNASKNSSVIRDLIKEKNAKPEMLNMYLEELRYYSQSMHDAYNEHHEHNRSLLAEEHNVAKEAQNSNQFGLGILIGTAVTAVFGFIISLFTNNNNNNNNNTPM